MCWLCLTTYLQHHQQQLMSFYCILLVITYLTATLLYYYQKNLYCNSCSSILTDKNLKLGCKDNWKPILPMFVAVTNQFLLHNSIILQSTCQQKITWFSPVVQHIIPACSHISRQPMTLYFISPLLKLRNLVQFGHP